MEFRAEEDGVRLDAVEDGQLSFQRPEIADPAATPMCVELREPRAEHSLDRLTEACRQRMSGEGCSACLEGG